MPGPIHMCQCNISYKIVEHLHARCLNSGSRSALDLHITGLKCLHADAADSSWPETSACIVYGLS